MKLRNLSFQYKERTVKVSKTTVGLGLTEARTKVSEDTDSNQQRAAVTRQGTVRVPATC
jgi:hypothetical protein